MFFISFPLAYNRKSHILGNSMDKKNIIVTTIAFVCLLVIVTVLYKKYSTKTVEYVGSVDGEYSTQVGVRKEIVVTSEILNSDKIEFVQRKVTGGGSNPGWVISLLETQPNIFTGRVIVDDGVYQYPVNLKEEVPNVFVGEMKGISGRKDVFSMRKQDKSCVDEENNTFEYSLSGAYGATQFSGCGGNVIKTVN
jgi:hypothetical protein